jgi:hypothetical protein
MGWSLRKTFRLLPGIRLNLSKTGPRLSIGVPGARASIDMQGKTRIYAGKGPLRFQKAVTIGSGQKRGNVSSRIMALIRRYHGGS